MQHYHFTLIIYCMHHIVKNIYSSLRRDEWECTSVQCLRQQHHENMLLCWNWLCTNAEMEQISFISELRQKAGLTQILNAKWSLVTELNMESIELIGDLKWNCSGPVTELLPKLQSYSTNGKQRIELYLLPQRLIIKVLSFFLKSPVNLGAFGYIVISVLRVKSPSPQLSIT